MTMQFTSVTVDDFSGGITDYPLSGKPNQAAAIQNLQVTPNKKLESVSGSIVYDPAMYLIPTTPANGRVCGLFASILPELLINSGRQLWRPNTSAFQEFLGPSGNPAFSVGTVADTPAFAEWNEHIFCTSTSFAAPIKLYKDGTGTWQTRTAGLPKLASTPTVASSGGTGNNYLYAFLYFYSYTVGTTNFSDFGPTTLTSIANVGVIGVNNITITNIPVLANGATGNYDTTSVKVYIYRSVNNGATYYKAGEVTNGTTSYVDSMIDSTLQSNTLLYTNSGILDNEPPPLAKYVHIVNGVAYYGNIKSGTQVYKNRIQQSVRNDPDSCPSALFIDMLDEVTGISSYYDNPIVFTKNHVYRINGEYTQLGQGQLTFEDITKTVGCMSHQSIVQTRDGLFWAGNDGFYWTDGFTFKKVSESINERYKTYVASAAAKSRIWGVYDYKDNRVTWAVQSDTSSVDNDCTITLDLRWGIRSDSTFTTRVNGLNYAPTALCFYNNQLIRGDRRGYLFKHDSQYTTDPAIDTLTLPSVWNTAGIVPFYQSIVSNLGYPNVRKWTPDVLLTMNNISNISVQVASINDNSTIAANLKEIRYRGNVLWGDPNILWGADAPSWSDFRLIENMRNFPAKYLRCSYKQLQITQAFTIIYNSDYLATASVVNGTKKATLTDSAFAWPSDVKDYYISFANDGYVANYAISTRNSNTVITFLDPLNTAPTSTQKWVIRGYPKGEVFSIVSYTIYFAPLTNQSYKTYRKEQDGSGGNS